MCLHAAAAPSPAIQNPEAYRLGDVHRLHARRPVEIRDCPSDTENLSVAPGGQAEPLDGARQHPRARLAQSRHALEITRRKGGVRSGQNLAAQGAIVLDAASLLHAQPHRQRGLTPLRRLQRGDLDGREDHVHVDAVEQRSADLRAVGADTLRGT